MDAELAAWATRLSLPAPIHHVPETGSTNADLAALAADGAPHGTALLADRQTAGRGRMGRTWEAPEGAAVLLSVLLRPDVAPARVPLISLAAAVATADACGPSYRIKWPNDVLAPDGRKVAGILAEMEVRGGRVRHVIVGVGINVGAAPPLQTATSLAEWGAPPHRAELAARLVRGVLDQATSVAAHPGSLLDRWRARAHTLGRQVSVAGVTGVAEDIDEDGALVVRDSDGGRRRVLAGDVQMVG